MGHGTLIIVCYFWPGKCRRARRQRVRFELAVEADEADPLALVVAAFPHQSTAQADARWRRAGGRGAGRSSARPWRRCGAEAQQRAGGFVLGGEHQAAEYLPGSSAARSICGAEKSSMRADIERMFDVAEFRPAQFVGHRPGRENRGAGITPAELIDSGLMQPDHPRIGEIVFRGKSIGRIDEEAGYECRRRKQGQCLPVGNAAMKGGDRQ